MNSIKQPLGKLYEQVATFGPVKKIRKSPFVFNRVRSRYFRDHPIYGARGKDAALNALLDNGVVVLPNYFASDKIAELHDLCRAAAERVRGGNPEPAWSTIVYEDDGIYRLREIDQIVPEARLVTEDAYLQSLAKSYLGYPIRSHHNYLDYKPDVGKHDDTTVPHMDSWMSQVKIFTLLNDIDPLRAPLVYWKRSHLDAAWRRHFDYDHFSESDKGSAGICPPHLLRDRCVGSQPEFEKLTAVAGAGSVVIADVRGFHRASNLFDGYRLEIVQKFTIQMP